MCFVVVTLLSQQAACKWFVSLYTWVNNLSVRPTSLVSNLFNTRARTNHRWYKARSTIYEWTYYEWNSCTICNSFIAKYFVILNIEILGINWKLWCYKKNNKNRNFLDFHISTMHGIFIIEGAIILNTHALNIRRLMLLLLLSLFSRPL